MQGETTGLRSLVKRQKLFLHPGQGFRKQDLRFFCCRTAVFLKLGTQGADRAAAVRQPFTVFDLDVHESAKPLPGCTALAKLGEELLESRNTQLDDGAADFVLGLEVVVDVAYWHSGLFCDVRNRGASESIEIGGLLRGL